jgi:hypothetical protein
LHVAELELLVKRLPELCMPQKGLETLELSHEQLREIAMKLKPAYPIKMICGLVALPRSSWHFSPVERDERVLQKAIENKPLDNSRPAAHDVSPINYDEIASILLGNHYAIAGYVVALLW